MLDNKIINIVGADVGFGTSIGVVLEYNPVTKKAQWIGEQVIPSRAKQGRNLTSDVFGELKNNYKVGNLEFTVDRKLDGEGVTNRKEYHFSPVQCVLMQHLLQKLQLTNDNLKVVSGMPISLYYGNDNKKNEAVVQRKIDVLKATEVIPLYSNTPIKLKDVDVISEGLGAYLDTILNDNGDIVGDVDDDDAVTVVDIGAGTTDIITFYELTKIDSTRTASSDIGVSDIIKEVRHILARDWNVENETDFRINKLLFERTYRTNGYDFSSDDISRILIEAIPKVYYKLEAFIRETLSQTNDIARILIVGGGADIYGNEICKQYRQAMKIENPQLANAKGFAKYGLHLIKG